MKPLHVSTKITKKERKLFIYFPHFHLFWLSWVFHTLLSQPCFQVAQCLCRVFKPNHGNEQQNTPPTLILVNEICGCGHVDLRIDNVK